MSDTVHPTQRITGTVSIGGGGGGRKEILSNTTAGWESDPYLISVKDTIYVYTDYKTVIVTPKRHEEFLKTK